MVTGDIVCSSQFHTISPHALNCAGRPVCLTFRSEKLLVRQPNRFAWTSWMVSQPGAFNTSDCVPTTASIQLYRSTHMENRMTFQLQPGIWGQYIIPPHIPSLWILSEAPETSLEVIRV